MFESKSQQYHLAPNDTDLSCEDLGLHDTGRQYICFHGSRSVFVVSILLFLSLVWNGLQMFRSHELETKPDSCHSPYSGLPYDTPVIYRAHTDYWGENSTLADELWESLDTDPVEIALSDEYAQKHGLPKSARFPWDDEKGVYFIKAIHDLHCLKVLRKAFVNYERGLEQTVSSGHVNHCLDGIRQDVMCKADDTPMPITKVKHSVGEGQVMQCRDWNGLVAWSHAPERNACFRLLDDYKEVGHSLERHQYCPEGSEYYPVMKEYFEKHGHKDPYERPVGKEAHKILF